MDMQAADLCRPIWSSQVARSVDALSIEQYKIPSKQLMEEAGRCVAIVAASYFSLGMHFKILCGSGNNGGDGVVAARILKSWGFPATVYAYKLDPKDQSHDLQIQLDLARQEKVEILPLDQLLQTSFHHSIVLDGLLGLGLEGPLRDGPIKEVLGHLGQNRPPLVIAIDLPSGLSGDHWHQDAPPLAADCTVTFGAAKPVHRLSPARQYCGETKVFSIGFHKQAMADSLEKGGHLIWELRPSLADPIDPWKSLAASAHKFDRGHVLVIGGSPGKSGAPLLCGLAAHSSGAGWVTIGCPVPIHQGPAFLTFEDLVTENGMVKGKALEKFALDRRVKAIVIGPGMVNNPIDLATKKVLQKLSQAGVAIVLDAGALHQLHSLDLSSFDPNRSLLTPHPGEFRRMLPSAKPLEDLDECMEMKKVLETWGFSLFYKTSTPILIDPNISDEKTFCYPYQNNTLAQAGSGDILAGIIAAYGLTGMPISTASLLAQHRLVSAASAAGKGRFHPSPLDMIEHLS